MSYDYEHHTWGGELLGDSLDYPRLKYDLIASVVRAHAPRRLLEIGCGAGKFLGSLRRDFPGLELSGVDSSHAAIERARKTHAGIRFEVRPASDPGFADASFDAILLVDVLEHVGEPRAVLERVARLLAPGGVFHAFIPCEAHSVYRLGGWLLGFHAKERTAGHIQRFTRSGARELVARHLRIVDQRYSFHLLGSCMDFALFVALLQPRLYEKFWRENRFYSTPAAHRASASARLMNALLGLGSAVAYVESRLLERIPVLAAGLHVTALLPPPASSHHSAR